MRITSLLTPLAVVVLAVFYLATAPQNHSTAIDSYGFAYWISEYPITAVPELRLFLWIASMQAIYAAVASIIPEPDPFRLFAFLNAAQTALAVVLIQRLLEVRLGTGKSTAWLTAACFAVSYGTWRYAAELEVYASAALLSIALIYSAFSLETSQALQKPINLTLLAAAGGLATLAYQPLGIVAGFAIPFYVFVRLGLRPSMMYYAVSGAVVGIGLVTAKLFASGAAGLQSVFDTDGKPLVVPGLSDLGLATVAFFQNILSVNWSFVFGPTRAFIETHAGPQYQLFLYPAQFAGNSALIFIATLPLAGILALTILLSAARQEQERPIGAVDATLGIWFFGQAAIVLLIDPTGFEAWLPALVPLSILIGCWVLAPLAHSRFEELAYALIAAFLVHNWFAGLAVLGGSNQSLAVARGGPVIAQSKPGDLLVVGTDWAFQRFLSYEADAQSILIGNKGFANTAARIEEALAAGADVYLFEDPHDQRPGFEGSVADPSRAWSNLLDRSLGDWQVIEFGQVGTVQKIKPIGVP